MSGSFELNKELDITESNIPGLFVIDLPVYGDNRGWFKENWQREKMVNLGLPDFKPVQNNISFNASRGATRGLHAEPWDKYISVATGRVFGAWVDLREGPSFGKQFTLEINPSKAIFVPRGVANGFQALEDDTAYTYLVNDHWRADAHYTFLNLADKSTSIPWPIPLEEAEISDKDRLHPDIDAITPLRPLKTFIVGADGQLGNALRQLFDDTTTTFVDRSEFDMTDKNAYKNVAWQDYSVIINAAAYTAVDTAETHDGRKLCWNINAHAVKNLAETAMKHNLTLVHISSDYVFDGTKAPYSEEETFSPLGVYGQTKAAGDIAAALSPKHFIIRTSWVIGRGNNFVKTMHDLAQRNINPSVVDDQLGRLTFTEDLAAGIVHLLRSGSPYGTYNLSNDGDVVSWAEIARRVYILSGREEAMVSGVTTSEYYSDKKDIAPRPLRSELDLSKIKATGFQPRNWDVALIKYMEELRREL